MSEPPVGEVNLPLLSGVDLLEKACLRRELDGRFCLMAYFTEEQQFSQSLRESWMEAQGMIQARMSL